MNKDVFVNCPFDTHYDVLREAIFFTVSFCGFKLRCSRENVGTKTSRLEFITKLIEECDLSIHDISRVELSDNDLPRFNMPFEYGISVGLNHILPNQRDCLVLEKEQYRYLKFISDINGQDISPHNNNSLKLISEVRNFLFKYDNKIKSIGQTKSNYKAFKIFLKDTCQVMGIERKKISHNEFIMYLSVFLEPRYNAKIIKHIDRYGNCQKFLQKKLT